MPRSAAALALLGAASAAAAQGQILVPAAPAEIAAAVASCVAATNAGGADAKVLGAQGWQRAIATDGKGKPLATPFAVYGRKGGKTMIMIAPSKQGRDLCTVTARIDGTAAAKPVVEAVSAQLKTKPAKVEPSAIYWLAGGKAVQLASTGDRSKPSVRISIMQLPEKSK